MTAQKSRTNWAQPAPSLETHGTRSFPASRLHRSPRTCRSTWDFKPLAIGPRNAMFPQLPRRIGASVWTSASVRATRRQSFLDWGKLPLAVGLRRQGANPLSSAGHIGPSVADRRRLRSPRQCDLIFGVKTGGATRSWPMRSIFDGQFLDRPAQLVVPKRLETRS
jgi:hypothetical protein